MMILGIPNVGKSTLMNALLKRRVAHVGDEPAITKVQMLHKLGPDMTLVDTPGMSWPGMEQDTASKLAATHSIGRAAYDDEEVALSLGLTLLRRYPALLAARFGSFPRPCDEHGLLAFIATSRHLVKAGGAGPRPRRDDPPQRFSQRRARANQPRDRRGLGRTTAARARLWPGRLLMARRVERQTTCPADPALRSAFCGPHRGGTEVAMRAKRSTTIPVP